MKSVIVLAAALFLSSTAFSAAAEDGSYSLDTSHAHIGFSVSHMGISNVQGQFKSFSGELNLVSGGMSSVNFTIDASSVDTNQKQRDRHIKSDDFFDVESFEEVTFTSTSVTYSTTGDLETVTGDLNLHGTTQSVVLNVSVVGAGEVRGAKRVGYIATTKINRNDFGIEGFVGVVGEEITITVNVEMVKN